MDYWGRGGGGKGYVGPPLKLCGGMGAAPPVPTPMDSARKFYCCIGDPITRGPQQVKQVLETHSAQRVNNVNMPFYQRRWDIISTYRRIELRGIVLPVPSNQIKVIFYL